MCALVIGRTYVDRRTGERGVLLRCGDKVGILWFHGHKWQVPVEHLREARGRPVKKQSEKQRELRERARKVGLPLDEIRKRAKANGVSVELALEALEE